MSISDDSQTKEKRKQQLTRTKKKGDELRESSVAHEKLAANEFSHVICGVMQSCCIRDMQNERAWAEPANGI